MEQSAASGEGCVFLGKSVSSSLMLGCNRAHEGFQERWARVIENGFFSREHVQDKLIRMWELCNIGWSYDICAE